MRLGSPLSPLPPPCVTAAQTVYVVVVRVRVRVRLRLRLTLRVRVRLGLGLGLGFAAGRGTRLSLHEGAVRLDRRVLVAVARGRPAAAAVEVRPLVDAREVGVVAQRGDGDARHLG